MELIAFLRSRHVAVPLGIVASAIALAGVYLAGQRSAGSRPHDRAGAPSVLPSPLPSALRTMPAFMPAGHTNADWASVHGRGAIVTCAICHPPATCLSCHGTEMPHPSIWATAHGAAAVTNRAVCSKCHQQKDCDSCHGISMPHPRDWVAAGHRVAARPGSRVCAGCHTREDCTGCHATNTPKDCAACHADKVAAIARAGGHPTELCTTCHPDNTAVVGPGAGHRTVPDCLSCHDASKLAPGGGIVSERDWNTKNGQGLGTWAKRGRHSQADLTRCGWCHDVHDAKTPHYPPGTNPKSKNCAPSCHEWLNGSVVSRGFTNASGDPEQTTYRGTIWPAALLANGTSKHTTEVYATSGCAGRCHQGPHGSITLCVQCHDYSPTSTDPNAPHKTHSTLVGGEESQANPSGFQAGNPQSGCKYCHRPGSMGVAADDPYHRASCWNCHLSAHRPLPVIYWKVPGA